MKLKLLQEVKNCGTFPPVSFKPDTIIRGGGDKKQGSLKVKIKTQTGYTKSETVSHYKSTWQMVVLILKGDGGYFRIIGLDEVLWKTVTELLNHRFPSEIHFHDVLHGFWVCRKMVTAALEAKLLQQLTTMREAVLYEIFPDLQKAYDAL